MMFPAIYSYKPPSIRAFAMFDYQSLCCILLHHTASHCHCACGCQTLSLCMDICMHTYVLILYVCIYIYIYMHTYCTLHECALCTLCIGPFSPVFAHERRSNPRIKWVYQSSSRRTAEIPIQLLDEQGRFSGHGHNPSAGAS